MQREIQVILTNGLEYAYKGDTEIAKFVNLKAPTAKNIVDCGFLKRLFTNAAYKASELNKGEEPSNKKDSQAQDISGSDIVELIYAFGDAEDIEKAFVAAKNIFKNCGVLDGEVGLTAPLVDSLSVDDFEMMVGEYIANFTAASMLGNNQKKN